MTEFMVALEQYGLAGAMAFLFWWTLRRMMDAHQSLTQRFIEIVDNHIEHNTEAVLRFQGDLQHHLEQDKAFQERSLKALEAICERLARLGN